MTRVHPVNRPIANVIISALVTLAALVRLRRALREDDRWEVALAAVNVAIVPLRVVVSERRRRRRNRRAETARPVTERPETVPPSS